MENSMLESTSYHQNECHIGTRYYHQQHDLPISMTAGLITARKEDRCDVIEMADRASPHNISLDL